MAKRFSEKRDRFEGNERGGRSRSDIRDQNIVQCPKTLTCKDLCVDMLEHIANEPNLLESVVTYDETWDCTYDAQNNDQAM
ncbi:hypothetical protein TNCV_495671 [Trichonephila clavipes]|nr:hypothetical protein TNCV_495671 [Trichonephila clavipes]